MLSSEWVIKTLPAEIRNEARLVVERSHETLLNHQTYNTLKASFSQDHHNIKSMKEKLRNNNAIVIKADKDNRIGYRSRFPYL